MLFNMWIYIKRRKTFWRDEKVHLLTHQVISADNLVLAKMMAQEEIDAHIEKSFDFYCQLDFDPIVIPVQHNPKNPF